MVSFPTSSARMFRVPPVATLNVTEAPSGVTSTVNGCGGAIGLEAVYSRFGGCSPSTGTQHSHRQRGLPLIGLSPASCRGRPVTSVTDPATDPMLPSVAAYDP